MDTTVTAFGILVICRILLWDSLLLAYYIIDDLRLVVF
jgi:hypothetical protein